MLLLRMPLHHRMLVQELFGPIADGYHCLRMDDGKTLACVWESGKRFGVECPPWPFWSGLSMTTATIILWTDNAAEVKL